MKRDLDIIWAILLAAALEDRPTFDEINHGNLDEHYLYMQDDGYLDGDGRLTRDGQEFIRLVLDWQKWAVAHRLISEAAGGLPVGDLIAFLRGESLEFET